MNQKSGMRNANVFGLDLTPDIGAVVAQSKRKLVQETCVDDPSENYPLAMS